ncbi:MAG: hypothetical protein WDM96_08555 [Lacunisphaera sp.]
MSGPVGTGTLTLNGWTLLAAQGVSQTMNNPLLLGGPDQPLRFCRHDAGCRHAHLRLRRRPATPPPASIRSPPMGATVDFVNAITDPTAGTGSLKITHDTAALRPGVLRLSGDNSFSGGVALAPAANGGYTGANGPSRFPSAAIMRWAPVRSRSAARPRSRPMASTGRSPTSPPRSSVTCVSPLPVAPIS